MSVFRERLARAQPGATPKRWVYVPYDQLSTRIGPLAGATNGSLGAVLIESTWKARRRPYHKQKLALVLANMRHFALELAESGVPVRYYHSDESYAAVLRKHGPVVMMEAAERELRVEIEPLVEEGLVEVVPHTGWLTEREDFIQSQRGATSMRMDRFYKHVRRRTGILMDGGRPVGGKFSYDVDNRLPWRGEPELPEPPVFEPSDVALEVCDVIEEHFAAHPGELTPSAIPATARDAQRLWGWAKAACMPMFGPYEDAMTTSSGGVFHTRIAPLLHLHRILPAQVIDDVLGLDIPLASKEGFVRQVLGWREFMRHVHRETDGFRSLPETEEVDGVVAPNHLRAKNELPPAFWGEPSGLYCLDHVIAEVWATGYGHHITRLMVLSNIASLLDVEPRQLADWFWVAYTDAYDWVVEPNVFGMGTFSVGDLMTTKPYVCGAAYIHKMSDFCAACEFHPKKSCPITRLYWAYLARHETELGGVGRLRVPLSSLRRRSGEMRRGDQVVFEWVRDVLRRGEKLDPGVAPSG